MGPREAGIAFIVFGVFLLLFGLFSVFVLGGGLVGEMIHGTTVLNEEVVVPATGYRSWCYNLTGNTEVHISLEVLSGGNRDINFIVMSSDNYQLFSNGESYYYYVDPSRFRVTTVDEDWTAPAGMVCFVLDNTFSLVTSKNVKITITAKAVNESAFPQFKYVLQGILALILGVIVIVAGVGFYRMKPKQPTAVPPPPPPPPQ